MWVWRHFYAPPHNEDVSFYLKNTALKWGRPLYSSYIFRSASKTGASSSQPPYRKVLMWDSCAYKAKISYFAPLGPNWAFNIFHRYRNRTSHRCNNSNSSSSSKRRNSYSIRICCTSKTKTRIKALSAPRCNTANSRQTQTPCSPRGSASRLASKPPPLSPSLEICRLLSTK